MIDRIKSILSRLTILLAISCFGENKEHSSIGKKLAVDSLTYTIFIEDTVFTTPSFYLLLKKLIEKIETESKQVTFYVDRNIAERVENYKADMKFKEAYLLEGFTNLLNIGLTVDKY